MFDLLPKINVVMVWHMPETSVAETYDSQESVATSKIAEPWMIGKGPATTWRNDCTGTIGGIPRPLAADPASLHRGHVL